MAQSKAEQGEQAQRPRPTAQEERDLLEAIRQEHGRLAGTPRVAFLYQEGQHRRYRVNYELRDADIGVRGYSACFWLLARALTNGSLVVDKVVGGRCSSGRRLIA
jgi:hypothetical protein